MMRFIFFLLICLLASIGLVADESLTAISTNPERAKQKLSETAVKRFTDERIDDLSQILPLGKKSLNYLFVYKSEIPDSMISLNKAEDKEIYTAVTSPSYFLKVNIQEKSGQFFNMAKENVKTADKFITDKAYYNGLKHYILALDQALCSFHSSADSIVIITLKNISNIMEKQSIHAPAAKLIFTGPEQKINFRIYFDTQPEFSVAGIPFEISYNDKKIRRYTDKNGYIEVTPAIPNGETKFFFKAYLSWKIISDMKLQQKSMITHILDKYCNSAANTFDVVLLGERKIFIRNNMYSEFSGMLTDMGYTIVRGENQADYFFDMKFVTIEKGEGQYDSFYALVFAEASIVDKQGKVISEWHSRKYERYSEVSEDDAVERTHQPAIKSLKYNISGQTD